MNSQNRVAIYTHTLLPVSQTFVRDQAMALSGWNPILIGRRREKAGLDLSGLRTEIVNETGGQAGRALRFWRQRPDPNLLRLLRELGVRLVHAHFGTNATDIWPTIKAAGLPMVVTLHGYDINIHRWWWEAGHGGVYRRWYPRRLMRMAQDPDVRFIAVSQAIKHRAIEQGIPEDRIAVSYIGVDTERFKPGGLPLDQRHKRILFVGRMVEKKAPLLMVRAYANVLKHVPDAELVMIGDGPLLEDARRLARALKAPVQFLGARDGDEVLAELHQAKVFCLPSVIAANGDAEGLPISIIEALACGVPCIATRHSGNPEISADRRILLLAQEGDPAPLAESLATQINESSSANMRQRLSRELASEYFSLFKNARSLELQYNLSARKMVAR